MLLSCAPDAVADCDGTGSGSARPPCLAHQAVPHRQEADDKPTGRKWLSATETALIKIRYSCSPICFQPLSFFPLLQGQGRQDRRYGIKGLPLLSLEEIVCLAYLCSSRPMLAVRVGGWVGGRVVLLCLT